MKLRDRLAVIIITGTALTVLTFFLAEVAAVALADHGPGGPDRVSLCHRTASDSNPYVFTVLPHAAMAPGHLGNTDPGHKPTYWKSDGTFRGVEHLAGDPKDDYLAKGISDCYDFEVEPTPTPTETVTRPTPTEKPPKPSPSYTPTVEPSDSPTWSTEPPTAPTKPGEPTGTGQTPDTLPRTGIGTGLLALLGIGLILAGATAIAITGRNSK